MNYSTMQKVTALFDSLPNFNKYGYFNEPVIDIKYLDNGEIYEVYFPAGYLKRNTAKVNSTDGQTPSPKEQTWILGYGSEITGIFTTSK